VVFCPCHLHKIVGVIYNGGACIIDNINRSRGSSDTTLVRKLHYRPEFEIQLNGASSRNTVEHAGEIVAADAKSVVDEESLGSSSIAYGSRELSDEKGIFLLSRT